MIDFIKMTMKQLYFLIKRIELKRKNIIIESHVSFFKTRFSRFNWIYKNTIIDRCSLGSYTYISSNCHLIKAQIGSFSSIGPNVEIIYGTHPIHFVSTHPVFFSTRKQCGTSFVKKNLFDDFKLTQESNMRAIIGNDVWIGYGAKIMEGITIGDGAIVLAGAYVTKNVESYSIVGGIPAKHIRFRFEEEHMKLLLEFKWWQKDIKWIESNANSFINITEFIKLINGSKE